MPAVVNGATVEECQQAITDLRTEADTSTFFGKQAAKEEAGLLRKIDSATEPLSAGKRTDTIVKLNDVRSLVVTIGDAGKLDATDAAELVAATDAAIACVSSIGA